MPHNLTKVLTSTDQPGISKWELHWLGRRAELGTAVGRSCRFFGSTDNLNEEIRLLCENSSCLRCCLLADFRHQRFPLEKMAEGRQARRDLKFCRNLQGDIRIRVKGV